MNSCPIQHICGGCPKLPLAIDDQRRRHIARVERNLGLRVDHYTPSPNILGYRARIALNRAPDGRLGYRAHRSHDTVALDHCPVARPEINDVVAKIGPVPRAIERVELRSDGRQVVLHARSKDKHRQAMTHWLGDLGYLNIPLALNGRGVVGDPTTRLDVCNIIHRLSPSSFYQVNLEVNQALVTDVVATILALAPTAILDLFSGAGNLSMPLAADGLKTTMIEAHPTATKDARRTATDHGLDPDIRVGRAEDFQAGDAFFDVAIIDPPRKGAGTVIEQVLLTRPKAVVMVSCNTATLAGDLKRAKAHGYQMDHIRLYEMFPHTEHVEAMGVLRLA